MSPRTVRWLHLSDFHVGKDDYGGRSMFELIIKHVADRKHAGFVPDLLLISGDLANNGRPAEYETFWLEFIAPLQEVIGGGIEQRTFAVPGNHDVDRNQFSEFSREDILLGTSTFFDPTREGQRRREVLQPRFHAFLDSDLTPAKGGFVEAAGSFSKIVEVRGARIGIVGINTAWLCKGKDDLEKLTPGKALLGHALESVKDAALHIVLGHHPLGWLDKKERNAVGDLLGRWHTLYLHGHLHQAWVAPTYSGKEQFLSVQCGAGFQAREDEIWRNGLVWAEADLDAGHVRLQPFQWDAIVQRRWVLAAQAFHEDYRDSDWWCYPLPGREQPQPRLKTATPHAPPKGWSVIVPSELEPHLAPLDEETAVRYFNGAAPTWRTVLSRSIPRRDIVRTLVDRFVNVAASHRPVISLLLAAGCEGKTTALLQTAYEIVQNNDRWRVLRRADDSQPLAASELLPLLDPQFRWLIVIDEADRVARPLTQWLPTLPSALQGRVHLLLACRDSDWSASHAYDLPWMQSGDFYSQRLHGLEQRDASAIVKAWGAFGERGLGDLASVAESERSARLNQKAREEARTMDGAFFGALLIVRHGSDLPNHARHMLERLGQRRIASGGTLRDAFALISAMHSEGFDFLSRPVLAQALGCPPAKLHHDVLSPLGMEAAATTTSSFIFTRHRRIAKTVIVILEQDFAQDIGEIFIGLGVAAINVIKSGIFIPENPKEWRFRFAEHFFETGRRELALTIGETVLRSQPSNLQSIVNLAKMYRKAEAPDRAAELFRSVLPTERMHRGFYTEWSTAEALCDDRASSTILAAFAMSDDCSSIQVNVQDATACLAGLCDNFETLFAAYRHAAFGEARMAAATIGQQLASDGRAAAHFGSHAAEAGKQGIHPPTLEDAFAMCSRGVLAAADVGVSAPVMQLVPRAEKLGYGGLERLVNSSIHSRRR